MTEFEEPFWSLMQSVGWVATRDPDLVSSCSPDAIRGRLAQAQKAGVLTVSHPFSDCIREEFTLVDDPGVFDAAAEEVLHALKAGRVIANGLEKYGPRRFEIGYKPPRIEISKLDWVDESKKDFIEEIYSTRNKVLTSRYRDIRIERRAIIQLWPELTVDEKQTIGAKTNAEKVLCAMMEASPDVQPAIKADIEKQLRERFNGLSGDAFEAAWAYAKDKIKPAGWGRPGRPRGTRKKSSD